MKKHWDELETQEEREERLRNVTAEQMAEEDSRKYADQDRTDEIKWLNGVDPHAVYIRQLEETVRQYMEIAEEYARQLWQIGYNQTEQDVLEEIQRTKKAYPQIFDMSKGQS